MLLKTVSLLFFFLAGSWSAEKADFLLLSNMGSLDVLSRYEQPLSPKEKQAFLPNAPLKILAEKTTLGDGITQAMEVSYEGDVYYLLRAGLEKNSPEYRKYTGCNLPEEMEMAAGKDIKFTRGLGPGGKSGILKKGAPLIPVFSYKNNAYIKNPAGKGEYVWCAAASPFEKKKQQESVHQLSQSAALEMALGGPIERANQAYDRYILAFNQLTGESREAPRWECSYVSKKALCTLQGMAPEGLEQSTRALISELRSHLMGKEYAVSLEKAAITVEPSSEPGNPK